MNIFVLGLLLVSSLLPAAQAQNSDKEVLAHFATIGACFVYESTGDIQKGISPCKTYCPKQGKSLQGIGCHTPVTNFKTIDQSTIMKDDQGNRYVTGKCACEDPQQYYPLIEPVIEALSELDHIICAVWLSAFKTVAEIGIDAIPGGAEAQGVMKAVKGAKTFADNGLKAADFFGNWVGKACGVPDFSFDITDMFGKLTKAPEKLGKSAGCFQKKKSLCKSH